MLVKIGDNENYDVYDSSMVPIVVQFTEQELKLIKARPMVNDSLYAGPSITFTGQWRKPKEVENAGA